MRGDARLCDDAIYKYNASYDYEFGDPKEKERCASNNYRRIAICRVVSQALERVRKKNSHYV